MSSKKLPAPTTAYEAYQKVQAVGKPIKMPWEVMRSTGIEYIEIVGNQISFTSKAEVNDFVTLDEAREAVTILAAQLGGTTKWTS